MELSNYLYVVRKRWWLIVLTTATTVAVMVAGVSQSAPIYRATTTLRVVPFGLNAPDYGAFVYFDRLANTYTNILNSHYIEEEALDILNQSRLPEFKIEIVALTELMQLTVTDTDPERAQDTANILAQLLISHNQSSYTESGLQSMLQERLDETQEEIDQLLQERDLLQSEIVRDDTRLLEIDRRVRDQRQTYDLLLNNYNQAVVSQLALANALSIIDPAVLPEAPAGAGMVQNGVIAGVVGVLGGTVLVFFLENQRPRFYTNQQVEAVLQSSVVGKVPYISKRYRKDVFVTDPLTVEAFRRLRANALMDVRSKSLRSLVVVSALPDEGKSTVASNLALSIASAGRKVLLVDADMYQARLSRRYRPTNPAGLGDVIQGKKELDAVVVKSNQTPDLSLLTVGDRRNSPAEMLTSFDFEAFIKKVLETYDVVIFDTPPLLAATDSLIIAPHADGVLWVIDRARTAQLEILEARDQLNNKGTNIIGIVVNRVARDKSFRWYRRYAEMPISKSMNGKLPKPEFEHSKN